MLPVKPDIAIGVTEIDAQHEALFERVARFEDAVRDGAPGDRLDELFTYLARHATAHFEAEERLMRETGYPQLDEHAREHSEFRRRLQSLEPQMESEGGSTAMVLALRGLLHFWLTDHVTSSDRHIGDHLRARAGLPTRRP
jgi:hemerythrin